MPNAPRAHDHDVRRVGMRGASLAELIGEDEAERIVQQHKEHRRAARARARAHKIGLVQRDAHA